MRLIHAESLQLCEFFEDAIPRYAILSHTWHNDEVTFQDMISGKAESKAGYAKITSSCRQALYDKVKYVWVDTCCIDKTSSAELSEAINSMYRWYENSNRCYAFMADVEIDDRKPRATWRDDFSKSRWFTRGWTLQELLAPDDLHFFSKDWLFMGDKMSLYDVISEITNIDIAFLQGKHLTAASIAERMAWASMRNTTRIEDSAYSLLGIFDVSMPLLYGEGEKAFTRLQEEILKSSEDQTIFAWGCGPRRSATIELTPAKAKDDESRVEATHRRIGEPLSESVSNLKNTLQGSSLKNKNRELRGSLARSPKEFCGFEQDHSEHSLAAHEPYSTTNKGLRISVNIVKEPELYGFSNLESDVLALIGSQYRGNSASVLSIQLAQTPSTADDDTPVNEFMRVGSGMPLEIPIFSRQGKSLETEQRMIYIKQRKVEPTKANTVFAGFMLPDLPNDVVPWKVTEVFPLDYWSATTGSICRPFEAADENVVQNKGPWGAVVVLSTVHTLDVHEEPKPTPDNDRTLKSDTLTPDVPKVQQGSASGTEGTSTQIYLFLRYDNETKNWRTHLMPKPTDRSLKELYDAWVHRSVLPMAPRVRTQIGSITGPAQSKDMVPVSVRLNKVSGKGFDALLVHLGVDFWE